MAKTMGKKKTVKQSNNNNWTIVSVLVIVTVLYLLWNMAEKFEDVKPDGNHSSCPDTIKFEGLEYRHLKGHDQISKKKTGNSVSCDSFDILSCNYGRNFYPATVDRACGNTKKGKTFDFCNQNDLVTVHFNMKTNQPMYAGKGKPIEGNSCLNKFGVSVDKNKIDNVDIAFGNVGSGMVTKCSEQEGNMVKKKIDLVV